MLTTAYIEYQKENNILILISPAWVRKILSRETSTWQT
jgi:hypothetical protein